MGEGFLEMREVSMEKGVEMGNVFLVDGKVFLE